MNMSDDDIRWIATQQPEIDLPDPEVTRQVRAAVMAHATRSVRPAVVVAAPAPRVRAAAAQSHSPGPAG